MKNQDPHAPERIELPAPGHPRRVAVEWVDRKGGRLLHQRDEWLRWDGACWSALEPAAVREDVYQLTESAYYLRPAGAPGEFEEVEWAPNGRKVTDVLDAAVGLVHIDGERRECTWLDDRDDQAAYVPCRNGRVDVTTGAVLPHDRAYFNRHVIPTDYDPAAVQPAEWLKFIGAAFDDDTESVELLQEWMGYVVSGQGHLHKLMGLIGVPRSGKGTVLRILEALVGSRNNAGLTLPAFSSNFGLQNAIGRASITIGDVRDTGGVNNKVIVERLLSITGQDSIQIDRKHREPWSGPLSARITLASNIVPSFVDSSNALTSRFLFLHFPHGHLGQEDQGLGARLEAELGGILAWSLEGLARLTERGRFVMPERSAQLVRQFSSTASTITDYLDQVADLDPAAEAIEQDAYDAYRLWTRQEGIGAVRKASFTQQLASVVPGLQQVRRGAKGSQVRTYLGLALNAAGRAMAEQYRADYR